MCMEIITSYITKNDCYKNNVDKIDSRYTRFQSRGPTGLMLHSVGTPQPSAKVFANRWNTSGIEVAVHAVLQDDGIVYQCLPWTYRGWHAGGSANDTHIGVEMAEPSQIKYTQGAKFVCSDLASAREQARGTYKTAVDLFATLCEKFNLDPMTDIISHAEGARKGVASNHADPEHLWEGLGLSYTMSGFRLDVAARMNITPEKTSDGKHLILRKGSTGDDVKDLQQKLASFGYSTGPIDGSFGNVTEAAVMQYQKDKNLVVDGVVGNQTWTSIEKEVEKKNNEQNNQPSPPPAQTPDEPYEFKLVYRAGDVVSIREQATNYYGGKPIPDYVKAKSWIVHSVKDDRVVLNNSTDGTLAIMSPFYAKDLILVQQETPVPVFTPYTIRVTVAALNIRAGAGTNYEVVGVIRDQGKYRYTIVDEKNGFGKLKSGGGWISLAYTKR